MKPNIFIGSAKESLEIAFAIQENLEFDANVTVWNQGVFNLSSNTLDDLIKALNSFHFAIFVFEPNDVSKIRDTNYQVVRDNVIFEFGLFIGKLGKEKVFYLVPRETKDFHLPVDLSGLTSGTYDNKREDHNLHAAIGPFCNQIRHAIKKVALNNLVDFQEEPEKIRRLVIEHPPYWEFLLAAELIEFKLEPINKSLSDIENDIVVQRRKYINGEDFFKFYKEIIKTYQSIIQPFKKYIEDLGQAFGPPGVSGNATEIKKVISKIIELCKELLVLENELNSLEPPSELMIVKLKLRGLSKTFIDQVNFLATNTKEQISLIQNGKNTEQAVTIGLELKLPDEILGITKHFEDYFFNSAGS